MKKTLIIALAGFMMLAFTQCGGGGSKEFQDVKKLIKKTEKAIQSASTCDELEAALETFWKGENMEKEYAEKDQMTDEEKNAALELLMKVDEVHKAQAKKIGCK